MKWNSDASSLSNWFFFFFQQFDYRVTGVSACFFKFKLTNNRWKETVRSLGKILCWSSFCIFGFPQFLSLLEPPVSFAVSPVTWSFKISQMSKTCGRLPINLSSTVNLPPVSVSWWGSQRADEPWPHSSAGTAVKIWRIQCCFMTIMPFRVFKCFKMILV